MDEFKKELEILINKHSIENTVDMPDFILAEMLCQMIEGMGPSIKRALDWHGFDSVSHPAPEGQAESTSRKMKIRARVFNESDLFAGFDPEEHNLLTMDGYDDCIIGVVERFGENPIVCYDKEKVLLQLELDGMDRDEADDFFEFNQIGSWMGDSTPCFLSANNKACVDAHGGPNR